MLRIPISLLAALALALVAAPAHAAPAAAAPTARTADALDDPTLDDGSADDATADDLCADAEDDTCLDDSWSGDDPTSGDDPSSWDDGADVCTDDSNDDGDWSDVGDDSSTGDDQATDDDPAAVDDTSIDDSQDPEAGAASADSSADDGCDTAAPAPRVTALRTTVAGHGRRLHVKVGFRLDHASRVVLSLERPTAGASAARCSKAARTAAKRAPKHKRAKGCARSVKLRGTVTVAGKAGANTTELRGGRWHGKHLAKGGYRLIATPKAPGATSVTTAFRIP